MDRFEKTQERFAADDVRRERVAAVAEGVLDALADRFGGAAFSAGEAASLLPLVAKALHGGMHEPHVSSWWAARLLARLSVVARGRLCYFADTRRWLLLDEGARPTADPQQARVDAAAGPVLDSLAGRFERRPFLAGEAAELLGLMEDAVYGRRSPSLSPHKAASLLHRLAAASHGRLRHFPDRIAKRSRWTVSERW